MINHLTKTGRTPPKLHNQILAAVSGRRRESREVLQDRLLLLFAIITSDHICGGSLDHFIHSGGASIRYFGEDPALHRSDLRQQAIKCANTHFQKYYTLIGGRVAVRVCPRPSSLPPPLPPPGLISHLK